MIDPLPLPAPAPTDTPVQFNLNAFILLGALPGFIVQANATEANIDALEASAAAAASTATTKATQASTSATTATTAATTSTTQAGIATTKAAEASGSATAALSYKNSAEAAAAAAVGQIFAAGTRILFHQSAAPTGWVRDTGDWANNRMLRVVASGGGGGGGYHDPTYNNVVPAHTHGFSTGGQSNDHSHPIGDGGHDHPVSWSNGSAKYLADSGQVGVGGRSGVGYTGVFTYGASADHSHSGSTDNGSSQTVWSPRYTDLIICQKA